MKLSRSSLTGKLGIMGEDAACNYLSVRGFEIVERNFHCRYGEIDVVCRKRLGYVFVEVKLRKSGGMMQALEVVDYKKLSRIKTSAQVYLQRYKINLPYRIDLIGIDLSNSGTIAKIQHVKNITE